MVRRTIVKPETQTLDNLATHSRALQGRILNAEAELSDLRQQRADNEAEFIAMARETFGSGLAMMPTGWPAAPVPAPISNEAQNTVRILAALAQSYGVSIRCDGGRWLVSRQNHSCAPANGGTLLEALHNAS